MLNLKHAANSIAPLVHAQHVRHRVQPVSIHAPAWGATEWEAFRTRGEDGFNPRTRVGCDFAFRAYNYIFNVSIHAPAWGATS